MVFIKNTVEIVLAMVGNAHPTGFQTSDAPLSRIVGEGLGERAVV